MRFCKYAFHFLSALSQNKRIYSNLFEVKMKIKLWLLFENRHYRKT